MNTSFALAASPESARLGDVGRGIKVIAVEFKSLAEEIQALPIHRLTADVDPRYTASIHLLKKHDLTITGHAKATFQLGQGWCDSTYLERRR